MDAPVRGTVVQIHPTRRCNLRCLHCYSSSGPEAREELPDDVVSGAIVDAALLGYSAVSFSGGEPLMYRPLARMLALAHEVGLRTLLTTNGTLTDRRHLQPLREHLDLLAMSLDGPPAEHDVMRAREGAFASLQEHLDDVRDSGIPFGFLFT